MKCPHCNESIGLFSKEMNKFKKNRTCPNCGNQFRLYLSLKILALLLIPATFTLLFLEALFTNLGINDFFATAIVLFIVIAISAGLKPA